MTKKRIDWIDTLRGIAMFFVVWGHCFPTIMGRVRKWIYSFHMPIFFFISGMTYKDRDIKPMDFIKKKAKDLLIPYVIFNIICYIVMVIYYNIGVIEEFDYLDFFFGIFYSNNEIFKIPCGPSWFLITLFLVEVGFYFLKRVTKNEVELLISISLCGIISYFNSISGYQVYTPWHLDATLTAIVFYYFGYLISRNMNKLDEFMNRKILAFFTGGFLGMIGLVISVFNRRVSMHANVYGSISLFYIGCLSTIIGLLIFVRLFMKKSFFFKNVGKRTMFYLGYSNLFILLTVYFVPNARNGNINMLLLAIFVTLIVYPFAYFIDKYVPVLCGRLKKNL